METLRRGLALALVAFLALAPVFHIHGVEEEGDHLASCPVASLRSSEVGTAPAVVAALASPTLAPVLITAAPRFLVARETPSLRGPPVPLV